MEMLHRDRGLAAGQGAGSYSAGLKSAEAEALKGCRTLASKRRCSSSAKDFRATVYLADVEGFTCQEIACITGVPVGTVMSRLHRARRRLRELLHDG